MSNEDEQAIARLKESKEQNQPSEKRCAKDKPREMISGTLSQHLENLGYIVWNEASKAEKEAKTAASPERAKVLSLTAALLNKAGEELNAMYIEVDDYGMSDDIFEAPYPWCFNVKSRTRRIQRYCETCSALAEEVAPDYPELEERLRKVGDNMLSIAA